MTKVCCYNFMELIYQWFEYKMNTCLSFSLYLIKLSSMMIGWKEKSQKPNSLSSSSNFQSPILKLIATFSGMG